MVDEVENPETGAETSVHPASRRAPDQGDMTDPRIPLSAYRSITWPAIPSPKDTVLLALMYQWDQSQWWPPETLLAAQFSQLEGLLAHAVETVPYYRKRLPSAAKRRPGWLTMDKWRRLPILRRQDIQQAGPALVSRKLPKGHGPVRDVSTSGSTGSPITVKNTQITRLFVSVSNLRYHTWHKRDFSAKVASIRALNESAARFAADGKVGRWATAYPSGPIFYCHVTKPVSEQLAWLQRQNPKYLLTYPSNLETLLRLSQEKGVTLPDLRKVITMSEVLDQDVRDACQRIWGIPVTDSYSAQEFGQVALQCPDHPHYHVQSEMVLIEVLGPGDEPCGPGETGRMVVTDLHNFASPLIRYEVGDYAEVGGPCSCGRSLPVLNRILGRVRNMAILPSGEQFWPQYHGSRLAKIAPVQQAQLIQRSVDEIQVNLVVARPLTAAEEDKLRETINEGLGHPFALSFVYVDEIPRAASGKFEEFVSEIRT